MASAIAASLADMNVKPITEEESLYNKLAKEYGDDPEMI